MTDQNWKRNSGGDYETTINNKPVKIGRVGIRSKTTGWAIFVAGQFQTTMPTLRKAQGRAADYCK